ncbi:MAG: aldo/keto reductase [Eggerthellaceae bacterium]|nr:aldo/keto reductase [Eggerthellaceae bacterium]
MSDKKLGFGFMRLPLLDEEDQTSIDYKTLFEMVDLFLDRGFAYFDTAYIYHARKSEDALRQAVVNRYPRDAFTIATKMPMLVIETPQDQERIFAEQLKNLGVDYFDYYLCHNFTAQKYEKAKKLGTVPFLVEQKEKGYIGKLGFSFHDTPEALDRILTENPEFDFVQLQINYLDWNSPNVQSKKCYEMARKHGKPIVVMEPVKGGTLAEVPEEAALAFQERHPGWSPSSWAIRFAASLEGVAMVLSGMSTIEQVMDNTEYMQDFQPLTDDEVNTVFDVRDLINDTITVPCTECRYCVEESSCPMGIPIPNYLALYNLEQRDLHALWSNQKQYYNNLVYEGYGKASSCIECHQCENTCPQHIEITQWLKKVAEAFEED